MHEFDEIRSNDSDVNLSEIKLTHYKNAYAHKNNLESCFQDDEFRTISLNGFIRYRGNLRGNKLHGMGTFYWPNG
jgi:hypothetical protein